MDDDQSLLTFTSDNWNTAQTVTVKSSEDTDGTNDVVLIAHAVVAASSADEFDTVMVSSVTVTVDDNDPGLVFNPTALTVTEGGTGSYTVRLTVKPSSDVTIDVTAGAGLTVDTDDGTDGNQDTLDVHRPGLGLAPDRDGDHGARRRHGGRPVAGDPLGG